VALRDRCRSPAARSSLTICSNGHRAVGVGANDVLTPDALTFLGFTETPVAVCDYNNTLPGSIVTFEQVGGFAYVTFNNVFSYGTVLATGDTFQFSSRWRRATSRSCSAR
jgi:hypothetical protein